MRPEGEIPGESKVFYSRLRSIKIPIKIVFFIVGITSTVWFLVRVIPKPSRAGYPCMRAAAPFMSSFIIYLLGISGSAFLFKKSRSLMKRPRTIMAAAAMVGAMVLLAFSSNLHPGRLFAAESKGAVPSDFPANQPMGEELGIFPGRVVWEWDPDATNENCTNQLNYPDGEPDGYFLAKNNNQQVINRMMDDVVKKLTGTYDVGLAWEMLFVDLNKRKGLGEVTYQPGQKIYIKINQGGAGWLTRSSDLGYNVSQKYVRDAYPNVETSAPMAIAVLEQLVNVYGVLQEDIYIGDPNAHILKDNYDQMVALFPNVKYLDRDPQHVDLGRTIVHKSAEPVFIWSDKKTVINPDGAEFTWDIVEEADYLINLACLKAHARAGVTLTAKNHFGTHARDAGASSLHPGLVSQENYTGPWRTEYGMYRVLTDIMGHEKLGGNTVLFVVEGLWGGPEAVSRPIKWKMAPFNNDWPSSILAAQDAVALESVCFDILKTEFSDPDDIKLRTPWYGAVDDHLHQAADSKNWPEGIVYDPEGDGTPMGSMGIHEHWNNEVDKQYSRNLGYDYGIELIAPKSLVENAVNALEAETVPVIDGDPADDCWSKAQWYHIDQTWINWGEEIDSSDFFGRFKISWSEAENLVYCLVEITDDAFIDGYVYPDDGYYNFDIVEVFIDEDASGGDHTLDENAFAYHLAVNAPAEGETETSFFACDLGAGWARMNYADNFPELAMKKSGNKYFYEFSMAIYDDSFNPSNPEASRVTLEANKEMGLSLAYCDNDAPDGVRDNFFGSVWVPQEEFNSHWENASGFGRVRLIKTGSSINHAAELTGAIADYVVTELNTDLVVQDDLLNVFSDPDGDDLTYTVDCDEASLTLTIDGNVLKVNASAAFEGEAEVIVTASDGEFDTATSFKITSSIVGISADRISGEISCFPNPFTDFLTLDVNLASGYTGAVMIRVYNMTGKDIMTSASGMLVGGNGSVSLEMGGEPRGPYVLQVSAGGENHSIVICKQ